MKPKRQEDSPASLLTIFIAVFAIAVIPQKREAL